MALVDHEFHCIADPGTAHPFAMLFIALNRHSNDVYYLDELYVLEQSDNSVRSMYEREREKIHEIYPYPDEWLYTYDEAALWFLNERNSLARTDPKANLGWMPTNKQGMKRQLGEVKPGISTFKDMMRYGKAHISHRCKNFVDEIKGYAKNSRGEIPKKKDDLLDCNRYFIQRASYQVEDVPLVATPKARPESVRSMTAQPKDEYIEVDEYIITNPFEEDEEWSY